MKDDRFRQMLDALEDPALTDLASEAVQHYISWEQMDEREPLPGLDAEETWRLLALVRRFDAITFPIITLDGLRYWYNITRDGQHLLRHIRHHCRVDSRMHVMLQEREGQKYLVRSQIEEAIASCHLDGVVFDQRVIQPLLTELRTPKSAAERLVLNAYEMLSELEPLASEPFTPELVYALYERLTRGVDRNALERGPVMTNLAGSRSPDGALDEQRSRERLQMICDFANRDTGDPWEPTACRGYMILSAMTFWHLLPDFNETVGRHMMRLFAVKSGYPALAYIPTSLMMKRWFEGTLPDNVVRFDTYRRRTSIPGDIDGTADMLIFLELTSAAISALLDYIERTQQAEQTLLESLDSSEHLNHRQRSVLARALASPEAAWRVSEHQQAHKVVYQTARADLLNLVERGFLRVEQRGKAFVFSPVPDLPARLRGGAARP